MNGVLVTSTVAPLLAAPSLRSELLSQLILGEGAEILAWQGNMRRVRGALDGYEGWIHRGYVHDLPLDEVHEWLDKAAWSEGALLEDEEGNTIRAHHRARLLLDRGRVELPTGTRASVSTGRVRAMLEVVTDARKVAPADWAWREFVGVPYLWGGISTAGVDCSGLVQTTFLARGVVLPRDSSAQVAQGEPVDFPERRAGDLLFFRNADNESIGHVAILAGRDTIVHSAVDSGGVTRESWADGTPAARLRDRLVAVRRHP